MIFENNAGPIDAQLDEDCTDNVCRGAAIFFYSYGRHNSTGGEGTEMGNIDGVDSYRRHDHRWRRQRLCQPAVHVPV